jgi:hypothetical protein
MNIGEINPNKCLAFKPGDHVVVCGRIWISEFGEGLSMTPCYVKIALFNGFIAKVRKENVALIVEGASSESDGMITNYISDKGESKATV